MASWNFLPKIVQEIFFSVEMMQVDLGARFLQQPSADDQTGTITSDRLTRLIYDSVAAIYHISSASGAKEKYGSKCRVPVGHIRKLYQRRLDQALQLLRFSNTCQRASRAMTGVPSRGAGRNGGGTEKAMAQGAVVVV